MVGYGEVTKRLGVSLSTLRNWIRAGEFPAPLRLGRSRRWRASDVDRWFEAQASDQANGTPAPRN